MKHYTGQNRPFYITIVPKGSLPKNAASRQAFGIKLLNATCFDIRTFTIVTMMDLNRGVIFSALAFQYMSIYILNSKLILRVLYFNLCRG